MTKGVQVYSKTPFSGWVRLHGPSSDDEEDAIDIQDVDYVVFNYLTGDLMTLEEKQQNYGVSQAQADTHHVLSQLLAQPPNRIVDTWRGPRKITYHGHHLIQFENTGPEDGAIRLDGAVVTKDELVRFINFGKPLSHHKAMEPDVQWVLPFDPPDEEFIPMTPRGGEIADRLRRGEWVCGNPYCRGFHYWTRPDGGKVCVVCHPPPRKAS